MALSAEQKRVAQNIIRIGRRRGESAKEIKAAIETGLVEANLTNPNHGDGSSIGWRQETASSYPGKNRRDVKASVNRFFDETSAVEGKYGSAHALAQAVQRSAFPGRYKERAPEAQQIIRSMGGAKGGGGSSSSGGSTPPRLLSTPGVDRSAERKAILAQHFLQNNKAPGKNDPYGVRQSEGLLQAIGQMKQVEDTPGEQVVIPGRKNTRVRARGGRSSAPHGKGVSTFEGKPVAAWIARELRYARKHGWKGQVNSGFRSRAEQTRIYNSGVRPAAKPGTSNHEGSDFPRGAVDVSDAQTLDRILRRKKSPLKFAGAKDPVHFSHPHNGSY